MADVQRNARLKGTIWAAQRTAIKTERAKSTAAFAKKKLNHATKQDEQSMNEQLSDQVNTYTSETREAIRYTAKNAKRIQLAHSRTVATSKSTAATPTPRTVVRRVQVQRARRTTQRMALTAQMAKDISEKIRKRAATAARSASKATAVESRSLFALVSGGGVLSLLIVAIVVIFGCGIALFGGSSENDYMSVSAEVEAYELIIRQYANQYHIDEYVDLIKAVMMQESGGQGRDPMQASECGYNTQFPRTPNGITDPEYSINVGIHMLAICLQMAGVENPVDMEHIRLALQGYNYGEGYITWAKLHYGGYSVVNAMEYSTMMAERDHWESYGDQNYVNHILRYYPIGHAFLPSNGQALVEVARTQLGNVGGEPYWSWYGFSERVEWCACFVSWCADQCGLIESGALPKFSFCDDGITWFKLHGCWKGRGYVPQPGDYVFFDWDQDGNANHVGVVESNKNSVICTIEGNAEDKCIRRYYQASNPSILGYGCLFHAVRYKGTIMGEY